MYLNKGEPDGNQMLSRTTIVFMLQNQIGELFGKEKGFGLGYSILTKEGEMKGGKGSEGAFDWGGYFNTQYFADPKDQVIGIIMKQTQRVGGDYTSDMFRKLLTIELKRLKPLAVSRMSKPKTGMAVTTDIGNPNDIHPTNKLDVGERLAKSALKVAYGKNIVGNGPIYQSMTMKKDKALLSFIDVGSGRMAKDKYGYLRGFEIAGDDHKFYYAQAKIIGTQVEVSNPAVPNPKSVRYGWTNSPIDANLFNKEGFPASPFRTDDWKVVTGGEKFE